MGGRGVEGGILQVPLSCGTRHCLLFSSCSPSWLSPGGAGSRGRALVHPYWLLKWSAPHRTASRKHPCSCPDVQPGARLQVSSAAEAAVVMSKSLPSRDLSVLSCQPGITIPSTAQAGAGWSGDNGVGKSLAYMKNVCFEKDQVFEDYLGRLLRVWPLPSL